MTKRKFNYYLYYKNGRYLLTDRENNVIKSTFNFRTMYIYIKERKRKISFDDIKLKSMLLSEFFRNYVTFDESIGSDRL